MLRLPAALLMWSVRLYRTGKMPTQAAMDGAGTWRRVSHAPCAKWCTSGVIVQKAADLVFNFVIFVNNETPQPFVAFTLIEVAGGCT